jgi:hypothetical protein
MTANTRNAIHSQGQFYNGRKTISPKGELWRAVADLLSERSKKKIFMKNVKESYLMWIKSGYTRSMSFVDFAKKIHSGEEIQ